jgi:hypothetical protein
MKTETAGRIFVDSPVLNFIKLRPAAFELFQVYDGARRIVNAPKNDSLVF